LSKENRDQLKIIKDELAVISDQFSENIAAEDDFLEVDKSDIEGLPADYQEAHKQADGTYRIDLSYPSYGPFMKYSKSESARKALFMKYQNRAAPENLEVLQLLLEKRREMANLLGYDSYSAYLLEDRMAQNPATVWEFEENLKEDLRAKTQLDVAELQAAKESNGGNSDQLKSWERSYYFNLLLKEKYELDVEEVKQYFALDDVIKGLFDLTKTLFDLEYKEIAQPSVWQEDVRMFEVYQDGKLKGIFYLDLHPRANKYNHAACFGIINGRSTPKGYQIPMASLVCNFPEATSEKPALMPHGEVGTFFHEFGHVLHQMLTTTELYAQSGTNVARDFVEAPSQIFENWAWDYDVLKSFSRHYETGEVLPKPLFDKMLAAQKVGSGTSATGQVFLGTYDLTLHDQFDPNSGKTTTDILRSVQNEVLPYPYIEGTYFQSAFGHLDGYGSSYYGYLWSLVYAQDMFSVFTEHGILDKTTGLRYRDIILARGSSEKAIDLVKEFLGRAPNNEAFLKELGLEDDE
jgi:thimet oligopeptidase